MKRLVLLAATVAYLPVAQASGKGEFSHEAEFRVRFLNEQNVNANSDGGSRNAFEQRFKLGTTFRNGEKFSAHLSLLANAGWGAANFSGLSQDDDSGTNIPDGVNSSNMVFVNQAYGTWMISDAWALNFGRGSFTLADGLLVSQNDWQRNPYAFDGALLSYDHESFRLSFTGVKAVDSYAGITVNGTNPDPEANFFGFNADWKALPDFLKMANLHFFQARKDITTNLGGAPLDVGLEQMRYGVVVGGDVANFDYKLNYEAYDGKVRVPAESDREGNMMHVDLGYSLPDFMKSRISVVYHQDSGDATKGSYDAFYYERHGNSGLMDVVSWGNLTFLKAAYTFEPMDQLNVGLHYWMFDRTNTAVNSGLGTNSVAGFVNNSLDLAGHNAANTDKAIGSEIDLVATKTYDSGFQIQAWYGMFTPGAYLKDGTNVKDTYSQFFVEGKMNF